MHTQTAETKPAVGILMLDSRFPRPPGDIGNTESWDCPVLFRRLNGASPERVVRLDPRAMLPDFIAAGHELVAEGARIITTSCGFLTLFQDELSRALPVPVVTSSLLWVAQLQKALPNDQRVGILTIAASSLTPEHLRAAHVPSDTPIGSTEGLDYFTDTILTNATSLDMQRAEDDNVRAAVALIDTNPDIGALVLECTNMGPYARAIQAATGRPVYTAVDLVTLILRTLS